MSLYNLRTASTAPTFTITKFDEDFNVESSYTITPKGFDYTCDCPANNRTVITKPCRHRRMMKVLLPVVDTDQFYDPDTDQFCAMLGDPHREPPEGGEAQPEIVGEAVPLSKAEDEGEALGSSTIAASSNGKTPPFEGGNLGSSPSAVASSAPIIRRR